MYGLNCQLALLTLCAADGCGVLPQASGAISKKHRFVIELKVLNVI